MKMVRESLKELKWYEGALWGVSAAVVGASYLLSGSGDALSLTASLIGVSALIFVAKGLVLGQVLTVVFSVFYGVISFFFQYYGEMVTYLCMTAPIAAMSMVSWLKHPYQGSREVEVSRLSAREKVFLWLWTAAVTAAFHFILKALGNASLFWSTASIATSFAASCLTWKRSPWYAMAYAMNDVVLIILWVLAAMEDLSCAPMIACFVMFLCNDLYGFFYWRRMHRRQRKGLAGS